MTGPTAAAPIAASPWLTPASPSIGAAGTALWCFPFAGGGASIYNPWKRMAAPWLSVQPVRLPGREARVRETPYHDLDELVEAAVESVGPLMNRTVAFVGYSMGALVAFELARAMRRRGLPQPAHLFICAHRAPHLPDRHKPIHDLSNEELREAAKGRFGEVNSALDHPELAELLLPVLRADLAVCAKYQYRADEPLDCPISVMGARDDSIVAPHELDGWAQHTRAGATVRLFDGDHFFLPAAPQPPL